MLRGAMVQLVKRARGRPRGSGKPDGSTLRQVGELLAEDPKLRPTTAIKRLIGIKNNSDIRRLQVKWRAEGKTLLSQAKERRERRPVSAPVAAWRDPRLMQRINEMLGPWATARSAWLESPAVKAAIEGHARLAELLRPSPAMQAAIDETNRWRRQLEQSSNVESLALRKMFSSTADEAVVLKGKSRGAGRNDE
jgi:hypothetical protein